MRAAVGARSCARARRALSLVLDDEAPTCDARVLAAHLGTCPSCRAYAADVTALTACLRDGTQHDEKGEPR